jgi:hypothetical protein
MKILKQIRCPHCGSREYETVSYMPVKLKKNGSLIMFFECLKVKCGEETKGGPYKRHTIFAVRYKPIQISLSK